MEDHRIFTTTARRRREADIEGGNREALDLPKGHQHGVLVIGVAWGGSGGVNPAFHELASLGRRVNNHSSVTCGKFGTALLPLGLQPYGDVTGKRSQLAKAVEAARNGAVDVEHYKALAKVAVHGREDNQWLLSRVALPAPVKLRDLDEIMRRPDVIEVPP